MDETLWGLMTILGPLILLGLLIWLVMRSRRSSDTVDSRTGTPRATDTTAQTEQATHELYDEEERRRRGGTDDL